MRGQMTENALRCLFRSNIVRRKRLHLFSNGLLRGLVMVPTFFIHVPFRTQRLVALEENTSSSNWGCVLSMKSMAVPP